MGWLGDARDDKAMERIAIAMSFMPYRGIIRLRPVENLEDVAWNLEQMNQFLLQSVIPNHARTKEQRDAMAQDIAAFGRLMKRAGVAMTHSENI